MYTSHCKWWQAWLLTPELFSLPSKQSKPCFCSPSAGILSQILSKWFADSDGLLWWTVSYDNKQGQHQQKLLHALSFEQRNTNMGVVISAQPVMSSRRPLTPAPPPAAGCGGESERRERKKTPSPGGGEQGSWLAQLKGSDDHHTHTTARPSQLSRPCPPRWFGSALPAVPRPLRWLGPAVPPLRFLLEINPVPAEPAPRVRWVTAEWQLRQQRESTGLFSCYLESKLFLRL